MTSFKQFLYLCITHLLNSNVSGTDPPCLSKHTDGTLTGKDKCNKLPTYIYVEPNTDTTIAYGFGALAKTDDHADCPIEVCEPYTWDGSNLATKSPSDYGGCPGSGGGSAYVTWDISNKLLVNLPTSGLKMGLCLECGHSSSTAREDSGGTALSTEIRSFNCHDSDASVVGSRTYTDTGLADPVMIFI